MLRTALVSAAALHSFIVTGTVAAPVTYIWRGNVTATTPYYAGGFTPSTNRSINNNGVVAGSLTASNSLRVAVTWDGIRFVPFSGLPGYLESTANSLNDIGTVVGSSVAGSRQQPTMWVNGAVVDLGLAAGHTGGAANVVNSSNQAAGLQYISIGYEAALWANGVAGILEGLTGARETEATSLNDSGTAVGVSANTAVIWRNGGIAEVLGGCSEPSAAFSINNAGQIAGRCGPNAVFWQNDVMTVIGPGLAVGVDDAGAVAFRSNDDPLQSQSYLWTTSGTELIRDFAWSQPFSASGSGYVVGFGDPVPEPATAAICALGVVLLGCICKRRLADE